MVIKLSEGSEVYKNGNGKLGWCIIFKDVV
jgi:hypothetical protein